MTVTASANEFPGVQGSAAVYGIGPYPMPVVDFFTLTFQATEHTEHVIELLDMRGAAVKQLFRSELRPGEYRSTFNRAQLAPGTYILSIRTNERLIAHEKLVVQ